jgi:formate dehydrogenase subunit gamma
MEAAGEKRVEQLKATGYPNATLYDPQGVDGTSVITVLGHGDHPEWYDLPADPQIPLSVTINKSVLKPLGLVAIFGTVAATIGHFMGYGPKEPAEVPVRQPLPTSAKLVEDTIVGGELVRHSAATRIIHWSVALTFVLAVITGLPIWTPIFGWMASLVGGLHVARWLHPWTGIAFTAASLVMFVHWVGQMRFRREDRGWFGRKMIDYFRYKGEDPNVGKYNGGQKILFWLVGLLAVLLLLSGLVLWWPELMPHALRQVSWVLHDAIFLLFVCTIIVHVYLGTAMEPGTFRSMTRGTVSKPWARLHHPRWYRDVTGDDEKRE